MVFLLLHEPKMKKKKEFSKLFSFHMHIATRIITMTIFFCIFLRNKATQIITKISFVSMKNNLAMEVEEANIIRKSAKRKPDENEKVYS